ncbi:MAG: hypothetical protein KJ587_18970 [Alphaproteobacteria bacterium]|nr:hypothetical protein [Alphaproteobacteria bacterium]
MSRLIAASLALVVLAAPAVAQAQEVGVYVGPPAYNGYYADPYGYPSPYVAPPVSGPRVYGYYSEGPAYADPVPSLIPYPDNGCGEYHYWDGAACLDARDHPPDVK